MLRFCLYAVVAVLISLPAQAGNFTFYGSSYRTGPWIGPACHDPKVVGRVAKMFNQAEAAYWHTGVRMAHITHARETAYRDWQPTMIARRYCSAVAYLSDGGRYELVYWVRSEQGFAGVGWGVQFCLVGRNRQMAYAPHCKMLRPL